jgi:DNA-binding response OmpR family regulator
MDQVKSERDAGGQAVIHAGDLTIDPEKRQVSLKGRPIDFTAKEFDLLLHFAKHPGRVYKRSQLLDEVWGYGHDGYEHTVNSQQPAASVPSGSNNSED